MLKLITILLLFLNINVIFSQITYSDTYTPARNGYIMTVPFEFEFINCTGSDGIPHLSVSKKIRNTTSNKYKYDGEIYTEGQLGSGTFSNMRRYIGRTDIQIVIYDGDGKLGAVTLTNVTGFGIGCQGQLYNVFKKLGINGKQYKDRIHKLSVYNLRIISISNSDAGLEMKIKEYNKSKNVESLIADLEYNFKAMRYDDAEKLCNEIKDIDYSNARANEILEKIKEIRKNENKEKEFEQFIFKGDDYYSKKDFIRAEREYKKALAMDFDNEKAHDKIWDVVDAKKEDQDERKKGLSLKKETAKPVGEKLKEEKPKDKIDQKKLDEDAENAAIRRRLAKRRKEAQDKKKKEFDKSVAKATKSLGDAFSLGIMSAMDNEGSIKIGYGMRTIENDIQVVNPASASTLELGYGFKKIGLSVGYSLFESYDEIEYDSNTRKDRGFGGTWVFGLDFTAYEFDFLNSDSDIGINAEYGFGKIEHKVDTVNKDWQTDYASNFYSVGLQLRFLNFLYVSYNYGLYKTIRTSSNGSTFPTEGNYSKIGFGLKYKF